MLRQLSKKSLLLIPISVLLVPTLFAETVFARTVPLVLSEMSGIDRITPVPRSPILLAQRGNFTSFFEEGRLLLENELRRQPPDPIIPVVQNSQGWQPVFFRSGGFSFWMPPGTLSEATVELPTQVGEINFRTLTANSDNAQYVVGYANQLTNDQLKNPQSLLTAITNKVVSAQNFKLVRNQPITQGGVQGRELLFQSDTEVIVFRAFLRQNTGYVIGARSLRSEGVPSRKTTIFLSSFEFSS